ncbi:MAG TPA: PatB family C-S lyase [Sedimentisphaerales bacterium]|nr:PatB family C-S lyase [Sedimentisphaerales bacterium]HRS10498.1 PatB family C-S lyase [Sedimentisphaerales bacterium]HRV47278.1 PatB family C-S lyase [Sedimentisphaerales bacterium]
MSFDFETVPDRRNTDSLKWRRYHGRDVIPMWVADMDFRAPACVLEALHARVEHGVFGYAVPPEGLVEAVVERVERRYRWKIEPSWIVWLPGLVPALNLASRAFGDDGDEVLTFTPAYPPFLAAPGHMRRELRVVPLRRDGNRWTFDLERFKRELSDRSKVLLLCNPHNPVGRRYEPEELRGVAEICLRRNVVICSDEIHCDLVLDGGPHVPIATLGEEIAARTITLMAPSKTFNIPGLNCAFAIIPNVELRKPFKRAREGIVPGTNALGYAACLAAYRDGEPWRAALIDVLRRNRDIVYRTVNEEIAGLSMDQVQATYLAWINTTELGLPEPAKFFEQAGVGLSDGADFQGPGYVRLNFGCPEKTLREGLNRMKHAVEEFTRHR